jgi:hypothetical protein
MIIYDCCDHCDHDPGYEHLDPCEACEEGCNNPMPGVPRDIA